MIRTNLRYHRPERAEEVAGLLAEYGEDAAVLGGGTWLLPLMNRGERRHEHVVDLRGLGLRAVAREGERWRLAATATYEDVLGHAELCTSVPLLARMCAGVTGGRQLRNQATLVGSACQQNPSSEVPAILVALGATVHVHGPDGGRDVAAAEFLLGAYETALARGEFVTGVSFAGGRERDAAGYVKVKLAGGGYPIATGAAWRADGRAQVVLGAVQACPVAIDLSDAAADGPIDPDVVTERVRAAVTDPWGDVVGDKDYRRAIAAPVARRAVEQLQEARS